jgi:hypothetical protein
MSLDDEIDDDLRGNCELAMFDDPQDEADYLDWLERESA